MIDKSTQMLSTLLFGLILSMPVLAQSHSPDLIDDRNENAVIDKFGSRDESEKKIKDSNVKDESETTKSLVPPNFGETPRYKGGYNPINPSGSGAGY